MVVTILPACTQWDLVCDKNYFVELSQTLFNVGVLCGFFICTPFGDRYGRKVVFFACLMMMSVFGIALAFSPNFVSFCSFQFVTGAFAAVSGIYIRFKISSRSLINKL